MRKPVTSDAVNPRAAKRRDRSNNEYSHPAPYQSEHRCWTCACHGLSGAKNRPTDPVTLSTSQRLRCNLDWLACLRSNAECSQDSVCKHRREKRRADNSIHVKRLEAEHLLNTIPGNDFGLYLRDAENYSNQEIGKRFFQ